MTITRWDPFREVMALQNRVNSLFREMISAAPLRERIKLGMSFCWRDCSIASAHSRAASVGLRSRRCRAARAINSSVTLFMICEQAITFETHRQGSVYRCPSRAPSFTGTCSTISISNPSSAATLLG